MESKWRLNRYTLGLTATNAGLIARVVAGVGNGLWLIQSGNRRSAGLYFISADLQIVRAEQVFQVNPDTQRFPYGFDVEPDN